MARNVFFGKWKKYVISNYNLNLVEKYEDLDEMARRGITNAKDEAINVPIRTATTRLSNPLSSF